MLNVDHLVLARLDATLLGAAIVNFSGSLVWGRPASDSMETKHCWMVRHDWLVFGSGWYQRGPRKSDAPSYTQAFVRQALNLYDALGPEKTVTYYNRVESVDGQW